MVAIGIMDARETAKEVKNLVDVVGYTSYQISNYDARNYDLVKIENCERGQSCRKRQ